MQQTLNQIESILRNIATSHRQVNTFGFGDIWEAAKAKTNYPLMWADVRPSSFNDHVVSVVIDLWFMDRVMPSEENELEVQSDMLTLADGIRSMMVDPIYYDKWTVSDFGQLIPFTEELQDRVSGWYMPITVEVFTGLDWCAEPTTSEQVEDLVCEPVRIYNASGTLIDTVPSGGRYDLAEDTIVLDLNFDSGSDDVQTITIGPGQAGTFTAESLITNITSASYKINTVAATLPFTTSDTDSLEITIVRTASGDARMTLTGTQ